MTPPEQMIADEVAVAQALATQFPALVAETLHAAGGR
jgi:hypothetical protein